MGELGALVRVPATPLASKCFACHSWRVLMKTSLTFAVGTVLLLAAGVAVAQGGSMMNGSGGMWGWMGGYGGMWGPILLVAVVAALVVFVVRRKDR